jgi:ligand-binding SRPBCC domain-containing protein
MKIVLRTKVDGHYQAVMAKFDIDLFKALEPKFGKMEIVEFTGSKKGDRVHIKFLSPIKADWVSNITEHGDDGNKAYFIDEGKVLPPGLKKWKHKHIVSRISESESEIIDDIYYEGWNPVVSILMYPILWLSFYPRKNIYRKYFSW